MKHQSPPSLFSLLRIIWASILGRPGWLTIVHSGTTMLSKRHWDTCWLVCIQLHSYYLIASMQFVAMVTLYPITINFYAGSSVLS